MKKLLLTGLLGLATLTASAADAPSAVTLSGSGSTFIQAALEKWAADYTKANPSIKINYQGVGSGQGKKDLTNGAVDFAASDAFMTDADLSAAADKGVGVVQVPAVAGAVVIIYNIPGVKNLKLDGPTLANIFLGKITKWNDPAIAKQNAGTSLPDLDISTVHRSDSSGTTFIFTDYLSHVSDAWKTGPKTSQSPDWPGSNASGAPKNAGVSGQVQKTTGGIGYVELIYALSNNISFADMKNASGVYVTATLDSVKEALATATIPNDYRFTFVNAPGEKSYPISGCSWIMVNKTPKDAAKNAKVLAFVKWIFTDKTAQADLVGLKYAPLPDELIKRVMTTLDAIK